MAEQKAKTKEPNIYAELIKNRVMVWDFSQGSKLYNSGFFGKPLGIRKPKGEEFDRPLELSLIEACYLLEKKKIIIYRVDKKFPVEFVELIKIGKKSIDLFEEKMLIYKDMRRRGLIPRPGLKFGADFAVYQQGPGIDHSPYAITALPKGSELTARELVRAGRLATSVRKKFVIATILASNEVRYYGFVWDKP
ncbi:MAG TPA: tRNA-intron lyase [Candidatus Bathyarchaeia archaeon]|nr:tRNA-intron lyase [Candidatus Bathyarchaeia archaeon]